MVFGRQNPQPIAVCGMYYTQSRYFNQSIFAKVVNERVFLPQVQLEAHATVLQTTSRVTLTQTFVNPSSTKAIREVKYIFPLYEGVSVVGFTCHVADRTIVGEVKEKSEAKQDYTAAVERGETAGLFEQLDTSDTFMTTIGNVPPGVLVVIELTYLGELKHDMEIDGIRFTIPNIITPRYGKKAPGSDAALAQFESYTPSRGGPSSNISITVDVDMAEGSFIQRILSPSHPISVSMGTTSIEPKDAPKMSKASATLGIQSTHLDTDFILQIVAKDTGVPTAILETHPIITHQRALMATLVPKFALPSQKPEIVFVCDRSGSMGGTRIALAKQALQIFLKSLPVGTMFNICSFGSSYSFLWSRSVAYSQQTLDEAVEHVRTLEANYGGTNMLEPLRATIQQRFKDIPLEVMLLTDGAISNQDALFSYLNEQIQDTKAPIRVYSLGVGTGVSHALVEGVARAGNGFSQTVGEGEKMNSKIVRMLKGALSPHVNDYTLEVKYAGSMESLDEDDEFEIVERVADSLTVKLDLNEKQDTPKPTKTISLFDPSADPDNMETSTSLQTTTGASRFAHLPNITTPKIIQAPQRIPSLFAFNRTTVYLLLGPDAPSQTPQSVVLRGTSTHGPLELEFPIQILDKPGTTIHQLAAKKATYELEQGRGWLAEAKDESGKLLKERYESRFSSMTEREAVRLGVQFQVSGKWCSFVAVEKERNAEGEEKVEEKWEYLEDEPAPQPPEPTYGTDVGGSSLFEGATAQAIRDALEASNPQPVFGGPSGAASSFGAPAQSAHAPFPSGGLFGSNKGASFSLFGSSGTRPVASGLFGTQNQAATGAFGQSQSPGGSLFGSASQPSSTSQAGGGGSFGAVSSSPSGPGGSLFGGLGQQQQQQQHQQPLLQQHQQHMAPYQAISPRPAIQQQQLQPDPQQGGLFGQQNTRGKPLGPPMGNFVLQDFQMNLMLLEQQNKKRLLMARQEPAPHTNTFGGNTGFGGRGPTPSASLFSNNHAGSESINAPPKTDDEALERLISLLTFEGTWEYSSSLFLALNLTEAAVEDARTVFNYDLALKATTGEKVEYSKVEWATALVIVCLETKLASLQGSWELVVDKAKGWLVGSVGFERVDEVLARARKFFEDMGKDDGAKARFGK